MRLTSRQQVILGYNSASSEARVQALVAQIEALPHKPTAHPARGDLGSADGPAELMASLVRWRPDLRLDILVNNAGVERALPLGSIAAADYAAVFDVNVRGVLLLTQAALPYLLPEDAAAAADGATARIVNIGSVGGRHAFADLSLYCASKAALEGLTRVWAAELGGARRAGRSRGATVNCICPGPVQTELLDGVPAEVVDAQRAATLVGRRLGTVQEVADAVAMLAGRDGAWISGQCISVSGVSVWLLSVSGCFPCLHSLPPPLMPCVPGTSADSSVTAGLGHLLVTAGSA